MWNWLLVAITKRRVLIAATCVSFSSWPSSYVTCAQHACRSSLCRNVTPVAAVATYTGVAHNTGRCVQVLAGGSGAVY